MVMRSEFQPWAGREDLSWKWENRTLGKTGRKHLVPKWEMDMDLVASVGKGALWGAEIDKVSLTDIII